MSTKRSVPLPTEQRRLDTEFKTAAREGATAQIGIGVAVLLVICYLAKPVLITLIVSALIAFTLEPVVIGLEHIRVPRATGSMVAVLLLLAVAYGASYWSYNRALGFAEELPRYATKIRSALSHVRQQTSQLEQAKNKILQQEPQSKSTAIPVKVQNGSPALTDHLGTASEVVSSLAFIPFLVYFMLNWHQHARRKTVRLFSPENRETAHAALGEISSMMRTFIAGNFVIGVCLSLASMALFALLKLPYFYFLGFISGFLSLIPYLGVVLAIIAPLIVGLGILSNSGIVTIVVVLIGLHVLAIDVLYPKFIGSRAQLNPLTVIIVLLVWGWMWGAIGLVLATPIAATVKIICDHVDRLQSVGDWLGE